MGRRDGEDGPALSVKGNFSWGLSEKKEEEKKKEEEVKIEEKKNTLEKFIQLRDIDLTIQKGEFVCVVGDVGSGKSSLLHAIIGDMIYIPGADTEEIGYGEELKSETINALRKKVLDPDFTVPEAPII